MRIRSITLHNVRRFTDRVRVGPIGDGVTLLCEPNEAGKSTLFDALHALFFQKHTSWNNEVKRLQPYSGGKILVEAEVDYDGHHWRIMKQWQKGPGGDVRLWRDGILVHQGDTAEDWIAQRVLGEGGGPGGLLWVRQGRVSLESTGSKKEQEADQAERRDLMTTISGAMDAVTGGERMNLALDSVEKALSLLQTGTGKPRKGGNWDAALTAVADLEIEEQHLADLVTKLRSDLDRQRKLGKELADLEDPDIAAARREEINLAASQLQKAERHQGRIEAAIVRAKLASQLFQTAQQDSGRRAAVLEEQAEAALAVELARADMAKTADALGAANERHAASRGVLETTRTAEKEARAVCLAIDTRDKATAAASERTALRARIEKAECAERDRIVAAGRAARAPDVKQLAAVEALARDVETKRGIRDAGVPRLSVRYESGANLVKIDGADLAEGLSVPLLPESSLVMPGIGELAISLPEGDSAADLKAAERRLSEALNAGGWTDLAALRADAAARTLAETEAALATQSRDTHAPDGITALREALAMIPDRDTSERCDLPPREDAERAREDAESATAQASEEEAAARTRREQAQIDHTKAEGASKAAADRLDRASAAASALPRQTPDQNALALMERDAAEAEQEVRELKARQSDLDTLKANLTRLRAVNDQTRARIDALRTERAVLHERLESLSATGVEERQSETLEKLTAARKGLERIEFEVRTLCRLRDALEVAKSAAHETYFDPINQELRPMLQDLLGAESPDWSEADYLPSALTRTGREEPEPIDVLSGGTQEQIAFLVRLAFARLLARAGRHAPLILDDALVYSDDDRIEKMFNALHGAADDLQIIVLSCRQRVFRDLGAPRLSFQQVDAQ